MTIGNAESTFASTNDCSERIVGDPYEGHIGGHGAEFAE